MTAAATWRRTALEAACAGCPPVASRRGAADAAIAAVHTCSSASLPCPTPPVPQLLPRCRVPPGPPAQDGQGRERIWVGNAAPLVSPGGLAVAPSALPAFCHSGTWPEAAGPRPPNAAPSVLPCLVRQPDICLNSPRLPAPAPELTCSIPAGITHCHPPLPRPHHLSPGPPPFPVPPNPCPAAATSSPAPGTT